MLLLYTISQSSLTTSYNIRLIPFTLQIELMQAFFSFLQVFEGTDLLSLPANPKNPQKYALKVLSTLFTDDELMKGMIAPVNKKGVKTELDPSRINILRGILQ